MLSLGVNTLPLQNVIFECNFRMYSLLPLRIECCSSLIFTVKKWSPPGRNITILNSKSKWLLIAWVEAKCDYTIHECMLLRSKLHENVIACMLKNLISWPSLQYYVFMSMSVSQTANKACVDTSCVVMSFAHYLTNLGRTFAVVI